MLHPGMRMDRVDDGIDHRRRRTDGTGLARALHAQRIGRARAVVQVEVHVRHDVGTRQRIVLEAAAQELARVLVIDRLLGQRLAHALADAAMCTAVYI